MSFKPLYSLIFPVMMYILAPNHHYRPVAAFSLGEVGFCATGIDLESIMIGGKYGGTESFSAGMRSSDSHFAFFIQK